MKGVILDSQTLKPSQLDFSDLETLLPEWTFYEQSGPDDVKDRLRGVTVAITNKVVVCNVSGYATVTVAHTPWP